MVGCFAEQHSIARANGPAEDDQRRARPLFDQCVGLQRDFVRKHTRSLRAIGLVARKERTYAATSYDAARVVMASIEAAAQGERRSTDAADAARLKDLAFRGVAYAAPILFDANAMVAVGRFDHRDRRILGCGHGEEPVNIGRKLTVI